MKLLWLLIYIAYSGIFAQIANIDSLKDLANNLGENPEKVEALNVLTDKLRKDSRFDEALFYGKQALDLAKNIDDETGISKAYNFIGLIHRDRAEYDTACHYLHFALDAALRTNEKDQIAHTYRNIGTVDMLLGNLEMAMVNFINSIKMFEEIDDKSGYAYSALNVGRLLLMENDPDEAIEYFRRVIAIREQANDTFGLSRVYQYMAEAYTLKKKYTLAERYLYETEKMLKRADSVNPALYAATKIQMGEILRQQKQYEKAADVYLESIPMLINSNDKNNLTHAYLHLADIYIAQKKFRLAKQNLDSGLELAKKINLRNTLMEIYKSYSAYFNERSNSKNSLLYFKSYAALKDSLYNEESHRQIEELKARYEMQKTIEENKNLRLQISYKERNNVYLAVIIVLVIFVLVFTLRSYRIKAISNRKLEELVQTKDRFFSIISHDLRNPFGTVMNYTSMLRDDYDKLSENEKKEIVTMLDNSSAKIYELLNNLLNWARSQKGELVIKKEKFLLKQVFSDIFSLVENNIKSKKIDLAIYIDETINLFADKNTVVSVLQNLISNAIKFTPENGKIKVTAKRENGKAKIEISDTGIGIEERNQQKLFSIDSNLHRSGTNGEPGSGLGLILCKEFVEKNNGEISVTSEVGKGTTFILKFSTVKI
ncbi:MAG: tetratricopeptide repeat protein [Rhodothermaceae bacterium]